MTKTIVGLFDDERKVDQITSALMDGGLERDDINLIGHREVVSKRYKDDLRDLSMTPVPGDIVDELTDRGLPKDDAEFFAEGVRRGGNLVVLRATDQAAPQLASFLREREAIDMDQRRSKWKQDGFESFDYDADLYSLDDIDREYQSLYGKQRHVDTGNARAAGKSARMNERTSDEIRVPIAEEELRIGKREVNKGGVRVHTGVEETPVHEEVTLKKERIDVDRHKVDRAASKADLDGAFEERNFELEEHDEELVVNKQARVTEEVIIGKEHGSVTQSVDDVVRRTTIDIERIDARDKGQRFADFENDFRSHCTTTYGKDKFDSMRPAYQYGYAAGTHENYRDYDFDQLAPHLRRDYEEQHGEGAWEKTKDAVRHAYIKGKAMLR